MITISPYSLRSFNREKKEKKENNGYEPMDNIKGEFDLFDLTEEFCRNNKSVNRKDDDSKIYFELIGYTADLDERKISFTFNVGEYGNKSNIVDVDTKEVSHEKKTNEAEINEYLFMMYFPENKDEAFLFMQCIRGNGILTKFSDLFRQFYKDKTGLVIQINPLTYQKAMEKWLEGEVREYKFINFLPFEDKTDFKKSLGHDEIQTEYTVRPKKSKKGLFKRYTLKKMLEDGSNVIEAMDDLITRSDRMKVVVELDTGAKKTITIGKNASEPIYQIEPDEDDLEFDDGNNPTKESLEKWIHRIYTDFTESMYSMDK